MSSRDRAETKTKTWQDVVKVLKVDESESADMVKSRNELESTDSIEMFDLEEPNLWAK